MQHASQDTTSSEVRLEMGGAAKVGLAIILRNEEDLGGELRYSLVRGQVTQQIGGHIVVAAHQEWR